MGDSPVVAGVRLGHPTGSPSVLLQTPLGVMLSHNPRKKTGALFLVGLALFTESPLPQVPPQRISLSCSIEKLVCSEKKPFQAQPMTLTVVRRTKKELMHSMQLKATQLP